MRGRRVLAAAVVALLAGGTMAAADGLRRVDAVSVADAVERYRAGAATTSTTTASVTAAAAATPAPASVGHDAATTTRPAPTDIATADVTATSASTSPPPGVYVYRTSGFEEIGIPGGRRTYPAETTMTVSASTCGADIRWDVFEERWDLWNTCTAAGGIELRAFTTYHEFFGQVEKRRYPCEAGTALRPANTTSTTGRCADGDAAVEIVATIVGAEAVDVSGVTVDAVRVRLDEVLTGHTAGTRRSDSWYRVSDGLLLRRVAATDVESETVFGHTSYDEELDVELVSLEPLR